MEADDEGRPVAVTLNGRRLRVVGVQDTWRIDDEWWRQRPVSRVYFKVVTEGGRTFAIYRDGVENKWYYQAY